MSHAGARRLRKRPTSEAAACAFPDVCLAAAASPSGGPRAVLYDGQAGLGETAFNVPDVTVIPH